MSDHADHAVCVLKFGGTSMGSFAAMQRCSEIVLGYATLPHHSPVPLPANADAHTVLSGQIHLAVVVSAVAGVTDCLQKAFAIAKELPACSAALLNLRHQHEKIVEECALYFGLETDCIEQFYRAKLEALFDKLKQIGHDAAAVQDDDSARLQAEFLAMGEKLSSHIFAFVLQQNIARQKVKLEKNEYPKTIMNVVESATVLGESLFVSDSNYLEARLNLGASEAQIKQHLYRLWQQGRLPVVAGFTAADRGGRCTLLGRGGSDYSAAIIAAALKLPTLDIWTDVAGIYSSDPRLVPQAKLWSQIDFSLVSEMAYSGAKVVHPKSISIALQNQVAVIVRSTFASQEKGTLIVPSAPQGKNSPWKTSPKLAGLVLSHDSLLLHMENPNMLEGEGYIAPDRRGGAQAGNPHRCLRDFGNFI